MGMDAIGLYGIVFRVFGLSPCLIHYHKLCLIFLEFNLLTHWNILWLAQKTVLKIYNWLNEKFAYPNSSTMPVQVEDIKTSISHITVICKEIPINVPIGNKRSKIYLVMTSDKGEDTWQTFNKRLDALFWRLPWWTGLTPPYLPWWVWHGQDSSIPLHTGYQLAPIWFGG